MARYDITKLNVAIDKLLAVTQNPRHRLLLQAYSRYRYLEVAGRYEEIFAPEMMSEHPVYHVHADQTNAKLEGQDAVKSLYRMWAQTNQSIFYTENEQVAVADNYIASVTIAHQQVAGGRVGIARGMGAGHIAGDPAKLLREGNPGIPPQAEVQV